MLEHTEYRHIWERLDKAKDDEVIENGIDTILHVSVPKAIENQLSQGKPPEAQKGSRWIIKARRNPP